MQKAQIHSLLTEYDIGLFQSGKHFRLYDKLGAHAAEVDGANPIQKFRHITIPLLRPTLVFLLVVLTIGGLNAYISNLLITNGGDPLDLTHFVLTLMYEATFSRLDFGMGSAISYLLTIFVFIISIFQIRLLRKQAD